VDGQTRRLFEILNLVEKPHPSRKRRRIWLLSKVHSDARDLEVSERTTVGKAVSFKLTDALRLMLKQEKCTPTFYEGKAS